MGINCSLIFFERLYLSGPSEASHLGGGCYFESNRSGGLLPWGCVIKFFLYQKKIIFFFFFGAGRINLLKFLSYLFLFIKINNERGFRSFTLKKLGCSKQATKKREKGYNLKFIFFYYSFFSFCLLNILAWDNTIGF